MRILTWNCNGGDYGKRADAIAPYSADIQVLSEVLEFRNLPRDRAVWSGPSARGGRRQKGVGIVVREGLTVSQLDDVSDPTSILSYVEGLVMPFHVVGIWSRRPYEQPTALALRRARERAKNAPFIVAGDFNSNAYPKWTGKRPFEFRELIADVEGLHDLCSAYHVFHGVAYAEEKHPTLYWYRKPGPAFQFHIDYVFIPNEWRSRITKVMVPSFEELGGLSDHRPVIVDLGDALHS